MTQDTAPEFAEAIREATAALMADHETPPTVVRVRATEVCVEMDWTDAGPRADPTPEKTQPTKPAAAEDALPPDGSDGQRFLCSPSVGTFYRSPEPNAPPFVDVGATVTVGQQIGIIEVMKLMIPVEADAAGRLTQVLKADAESVEYGDRLFALADVD